MRVSENDTRRLGVAINQLRIDGRSTALTDARLSSGWHAAEADLRWTDGDAGLSLSGVSRLSFDVAMTGTYRHETDEAGHPSEPRRSPGRASAA
jgi:hypothetical protein